jgi:hypothetical protein
MPVSKAVSPLSSDELELKQLPILAVDDEEANLLLLQRILEGYSALARKALSRPAASASAAAIW